MNRQPATHLMTLIGNHEFHWGERTFIMGILNVTPDSFSGDGFGSDVDAALARARQMVIEGANIVDVGGESTRPGAPEVTAEAEIARVVPVIQRLRTEIEVPVSIDTYKSEVAEAAIRAGASMINSVFGLKRDPMLAGVATRFGVPIVLTSSQRDGQAEDIIPAVLQDLRCAITEAESAGVRPENIIVDPGFGFGKTVSQNLELLHSLDELTKLGKPIMLGTSRKSTIGKVLGDIPADQRLFGTVATTVIGIMNGANLIRVHDIKENVQAARMTDAVAKGLPQNVNRAHTVFLGLGSNMGDRLQNLESAVKSIGQKATIVKSSSVYETEPVGVPDQPKFLNMAIECQTTLTPEQLLRFLKSIEHDMGRGNSGSDAPRPIDIDILFYDDRIVFTESLTIPHSRLSQRAFVLVPLNDLAPDFVHRVLKKTVREMLSALDKFQGIELYRCSLPFENQS